MRILNDSVAILFLYLHTKTNRNVLSLQIFVWVLTPADFSFNKGCVMLKNGLRRSLLQSRGLVTNIDLANVCLGEHAHLLCHSVRRRLTDKGYTAGLGDNYSVCTK